MRYQIWLSLPLAAALIVPAVAQQNTETPTQNAPAAQTAPATDTNQPTNSQTAAPASADQSLSAHQPL